MSAVLLIHTWNNGKLSMCPSLKLYNLRSPAESMVLTDTLPGQVRGELLRWEGITPTYVGHQQRGTFVSF